MIQLLATLSDLCTEIAKWLHISTSYANDARHGVQNSRLVTLLRYGKVTSLSFEHDGCIQCTGAVDILWIVNLSVARS